MILMKKRILAIILILIIFTAAGIAYLNKAVLPTKVKSLIVKTLQDSTHKKVSLDSLTFSLFRGLVFKNLIIYDADKAVLSIREGSCRFLILPIFKRNIIIPKLRLDSPVIFVERKKDGTFNVRDLLPKQEKSAQNQKFVFRVYNIEIADGNINFQDDTFDVPFTKVMEHLDLSIRLSLPASINFSFDSEIRASPNINLGLKGVFKIPERNLSAKALIRNFCPKEFAVYYQDLGFSLPEGLADIEADLRFADGNFSVDSVIHSKALVISKEPVLARLSSDLRLDIKYNLKDRLLEYSGKAKIFDSTLSGLHFVGDINNINAEASFNNAGIASDNLSCRIWGQPVEARLGLNDFKNPLLNIRLKSDLSLASLQGILKDKFDLSLPAKIEGEASLSLDIKTNIPAKEDFEISGSLDILKAAVRLDKIDNPIQEISGRLEFSRSQLRWLDLSFKYLENSYKTKGVLTDFQKPGIQLEVFSQDLSLESVFALNGKLIKLSKLSGRYLNSEFNLSGDVNTADPSVLEADINGSLNINLEDIKGPLKKFQSQLVRIKPAGIIEAQFQADGNIKDIKSCDIQARISGPAVSAYGLKAQDLILEVNQKNGIIDIPLLRLSLYEGMAQAKAGLNLNSPNLAYWVEADIEGVKLEKLKLDTAVKDKDIAGSINGQIKLNGFSAEPAKLSGAGKIFISEGKLWQLNLFKGLGALLFAKDFSSIIFSEGRCDFQIQDVSVFTDNLVLKSQITNLSGPVKIGFDRSISASLSVQVLDQFVPLSGTFKDITTAIIGQAGRFGVIKISGTLDSVKYSFQPAVVDIIKGLKDAILGQ